VFRCWHNLQRVPRSTCRSCLASEYHSNRSFISGLLEDFISALWLLNIHRTHYVQQATVRQLRLLSLERASRHVPCCLTREIRVFSSTFPLCPFLLAFSNWICFDDTTNWRRKLQMTYFAWSFHMWHYQSSFEYSTQLLKNGAALSSSFRHLRSSSGIATKRNTNIYPYLVLCQPVITNHLYSSFHLRKGTNSRNIFQTPAIGVKEAWQRSV
jgi:hypothetical protein